MELYIEPPTQCPHDLDRGNFGLLGVKLLIKSKHDINL